MTKRLSSHLGRRVDAFCDRFGTLVAVGEASFQQFLQCRQQTPGNRLFSFGRVVSLGFEQNVQLLRVTGGRFNVNSERNHSIK